MDDQNATQTGSGNLLFELDRRQNVVMEELDVLNARIEKLLGEWSESRSEEVIDDMNGEAHSQQAA